MIRAQKVYLAGRYSRREELCGYADDLRGFGLEVTSRWLIGHPFTDEQLSPETNREQYEQMALVDFDDVGRANWLIAFTEPPRSTASRGSRHVEMGIALGMGKTVTIVGEHENNFCYLPGLIVFDRWETLLEGLRMERSLDMELSWQRGELGFW